jgi:hypothetical protein
MRVDQVMTHAVERVRTIDPVVSPADQAGSGGDDSRRAAWTPSVMT